MQGAIEELAVHPAREAARAHAPLGAPPRAARTASLATLAAVVLGSSFAGGTARAEPPSGGFGRFGLAFGTSSQPSECSYCERVFGPAMEGSYGRMVRDSLAIRGDLWLYTSGEGYPSAGVMFGAQMWPGEGFSLHAALGTALYVTDNSDGGPGDGAGLTAALTAGFELWRSEAAVSELELRGMLFGSGDLGYVTFAFAGYAMRWD